MNKTLKKWTLRILKNLAIFLVVILVMEFFLSRDISKGPIPSSLAKNLPLLDSQRRADLFDSKEGVSLVYVFAPWCGVCSISAANLNPLVDFVPVKALGVSWRTVRDLTQFAKESDLRVPILVGNDEKMLPALGVSAFPSYLMMNQDGHVIYAWTGYTSTVGLYFRVIMGRLFASF